MNTANEAACDDITSSKSFAHQTVGRNVGLSVNVKKAIHTMGMRSLLRPMRQRQSRLSVTTICLVSVASYHQFRSN